MINRNYFVSIVFSTLLMFCLTTTAQTIFESAVGSGTGYNVKETADGGFVICGSTLAEATLLKVDSNGNFLWEKRFGDISGLHPEHAFYDLLIMSDGGYLLAGRGRPFNLNSFAYFVRTDINGNQMWDLKVYSDIDSTWDEYYAMKMFMTSTGEIIAAGNSDDNVGGVNEDYTLTKIDTLGNLISRKHIDISTDELLTDFIYTDTAYYFLGIIDIMSNKIFNVTKTDTSGNIIINQNYGANLNSVETAYSMLLDSNENVHIAGEANYLSGQNYFLNVYLINGDTAITNIYPVSAPWQTIQAVNMVKMKDKYFLAGQLSLGSPDQAFMVCVDTNGMELSRTLYGGSDYDAFSKIIVTSDSNLICVGRTSSFSSAREVYIVKIDPDIILSTNNTFSNPQFNILVNRENITLEFQSINDLKIINLYSVSGTKLFQTTQTGQSIPIDISSFPAGMYILNIQMNGQQFSKKILVSRN